MTTFADVLTIKNGKNQKQVENPRGEYPIYSATGVSGQANDYLCEGNAVIIGRRGPIQQPIFVPAPFWHGDSTFSLLSKEQVLFPKYLYYFCKNLDFKALTPGCTMPTITKNTLLNIPISLPSLEKQKEIAAEMDNIAELIQLRKKQLENLNLLAKGKFLEMFGDPVKNPMGWEIEKLHQLGKLTRGISQHIPKKDSDLLEKSYPFIQISQVSNSNLYIKKYDKTYDEGESPKNQLWKSGTVCIAMANHLGKTALLSFDAYFSSNIAGFQANDRTNPLFIHYWFSFFHEIIEALAPVCGPKTITTKLLGDLSVITPPLPLQEEFAHYVQTVEETRDAMEQELEKLDILSQERMQNWFGGTSA